MISDPIFIAIGILANLIVGWVAHKFWAAKGPTEKAVALKVLTAAIEQVAKLNAAPTAQEAAAMAAAAANEAALIDAAKAAVSKL